MVTNIVEPSTQTLADAPSLSPAAQQLQDDTIAWMISPEGVQHSKDVLEMAFHEHVKELQKGWVNNG